MTLRRPKLILIDVDGTLVDSVPDLAFCVDALMDELGMPRRGEAVVRTWVGNGVERLVKRALINRLDGEPHEALFERALPRLPLIMEITVSACHLCPYDALSKRRVIKRRYRPEGGLSVGHTHFYRVNNGHFRLVFQRR